MVIKNWNEYRVECWCILRIPLLHVVKAAMSMLTRTGTIVRKQQQRRRSSTTSRHSHGSRRESATTPTPSIGPCPSPSPSYMLAPDGGHSPLWNGNGLLSCSPSPFPSPLHTPSGFQSYQGKGVTFDFTVQCDSLVAINTQVIITWIIQ